MKIYHRRVLLLPIQLAKAKPNTDNPVKILIVKTYPKEVNTSTYNCQEVGLALSLRKAGHECDILCTTDSGQYHEKKVETEGHTVTIFCAKSFNLKDNAWFIGVDKILNRYDILQTGEYNELYTWHLARKYAHKTVVCHGPYYSPYMWKYNRMARIFDSLFLGRYKRLNTTFITKSRLAEEYLRSKGLNNVSTIGVGTVNMEQSNEGDTIFSKRIKAAKGTKLLYIGVMNDRRNVLFLLDVLKAVLQTGVNTTLVLVGKFGSDDYKQAFYRAVEEKHLTDNIIYEPVVKQSEIAQVYDACDIFLFPTRYDIYGMVLLEAMYRGLPTISTLCGGSQMLIESGRNGLIIGDYDAAKWADAIVSLVNNPKRSEYIGQAAAAIIATRFTWDALVPQFIDIYSSKINH